MTILGNFLKKGFWIIQSTIWLTIPSPYPVLAEKAIDPALLKQFNIRTVDNQKVIEISMRNLLSVVLERATTIKTIALHRQIAEDDLYASRRSNNPILTNSIKVNKSVNDTKQDQNFLKYTDVNTTSVSASFSKTIDNGITYGIGIDESTTKVRSATQAESGGSLDSWTTVGDTLNLTTISATVNVPLYQGWGDINRLDDFRSEIGLVQTKIAGQKSIQDLLSTVAGLYWDLVGVLKTIESLKSSVELSKQFLEDNRIRYETGLLDVVEVKQSESQLARTQQNLLQVQTRKKKIEDQIRAVLNLEQLPIGYWPVEELKIRKIDQQFPELLQHIFETDNELKRLDTLLQLNSLEQKSALDSDKPDLDFSLAYNWKGLGKSIGESLEETTNRELSDYSVGLTWKIPLFDAVTPQKIHKAVLERAKIDVDMRNRKTELNVELQAVLRDLKLVEKGIKLAEISESLAQGLLDREIEKFKLGNSTSYRVSQARQDLLDAQKDEITARVNYEKTFLSFLVLTNQLVNHYQLQKISLIPAVPSAN